MNRRLLTLLSVLLVILVGLSFLAFKILSTPKPKTKTTLVVNKTLKTPQVGLTLLATGLTEPTDIVSTKIAGDKRLFITQKTGVIGVLGSDGKVSSISLLDISDLVQDKDEMGLLGLAFHPNFSQNGFFYVNYVDKARNTIIARFTLQKGSAQAEPSTEKQLLKIPQPYPNHKGGDLHFGKDGYLYIGLGDGGSSGDPENRAQNLNEYLGKILRVNVNSGDPYSIPSANPFVNKPNVKQEVWDYGLRNPWRFSFDKAGNLWIADVGQGKIEEIDLEKANSKGGFNYGWRCYEGSYDYNNSGCAAKSSYTFPILEYDHSEQRCSITGGYVYEGGQFQALAGKYFYGDYCNGELFYTEQIKGSYQQTLALSTPYKISTFGQDSSGELYLADIATGSIYKIVDLAN
ncbi:MAG TPA: PQQ-dependent sugar dehydrogenase [Candidatus Saccharimonadales bacterium]|nr:PQQ-dependent sugar dehydrogenase [Candidatus Saccharimonadales bacterium]